MSIKTWKQRMGISPNFKVLLGIGQICLVAAIFIGRLDLTPGFWNFIEGMLLGISMVTNLAGLATYNQQGKEN